MLGCNAYTQLKPPYLRVGQHAFKRHILFPRHILFRSNADGRARFKKTTQILILSFVAVYSWAMFISPLFYSDASIGVIAGLLDTRALAGAVLFVAMQTSKYVGIHIEKSS